MVNPLHCLIKPISSFLLFFNRSPSPHRAVQPIDFENPKLSFRRLSNPKDDENNHKVDESNAVPSFANDEDTLEIDAVDSDLFQFN